MHDEPEHRSVVTQDRAGLSVPVDTFGRRLRLAGLLTRREPPTRVDGVHLTVFVQDKPQWLQQQHVTSEERIWQDCRVEGSSPSPPHYLRGRGLLPGTTYVNVRDVASMSSCPTFSWMKRTPTPSIGMRNG